MDYIMSFLFLIFNFVLIYFIAIYINKFSDQGIIFGIRVPIEYRKDSKIKTIDKLYKRSCLIYCVLVTFLSIAINFFNYSASMIVQIYFLLVAILIPYVKAHNAMKKLKKELGWQALSKNRIILSFENKKEKITLSLWWFLIPLYLGLVTLAEVFLFYPKIPASLPMQFDFLGNVTSYANSNLFKTKFFIFMLPIFSLFITLISVLIIHFFIKKGDRLNGGKISTLIKEKKIFKREMSLMLFFTSLVISLLFTFLTSIILGVLKVKKVTFMFINILFLTLIIFIPFLFIFKVLKERNVTIYSDEDELYKDDDSFYKLGLFYYNPNDPAIMVEKRVGIGYDFNYATWPAKIFIVIISSILLFSLIVSFVH